MRAKYRRWCESHPRLYASRHVIAGAGQVIVAILGITLAIHLLPAIPLPNIDLPRINLPDIPWPSISLPDITVPEWMRDIARSKPYWLPIVLGIVVAARELKKRRTTLSDRDRGDAARPGPGAPA